MPNDYALARQARKKPHIQMGPKGGKIQRVPTEEEQDPSLKMRGKTDPKDLLKSDTQRIDPNTYTPEQIWKQAPLGGGSTELAGKQVQKI
jgi:hypothetical protein